VTAGTHPQRQRPAVIPAGSWPARMPADLAAGYCGETTVQAFMKRWKRGEYPPPTVNDGRRKLWLKDDLDRAILPADRAAVQDAADDL